MSRDELDNSRWRAGYRRRCKAYEHASWEPALERLHANELPWRASGDDSRRGLQPLSRAAAA